MVVLATEATPEYQLNPVISPPKESLAEDKQSAATAQPRRIRLKAFISVTSFEDWSWPEQRILP
jgi:hypothetical protein